MPPFMCVCVFFSDEVFADKIPTCPDCKGVVKPGLKEIELFIIN